MIRIIEKEASCLGEKIYLNAVLTDEGITVSLTGGHKAHIGAVAVVNPTGKLSLQTFLCHKEGELAKSFAEKIFETTGHPVVVSAGIHYDNIDKTGIMEVLEVSDKLLRDFIKKILTNKDFKYKKWGCRFR